MIDQTRIIDQPEPGYYRIREVPKGPWVAARIEHGAFGWRATVNGRGAGFPSHDPLTADAVMSIHFYGIKITRTEYLRLIPHPHARKPVDYRSEPPPSF